MLGCVGGVCCGDYHCGCGCVFVGGRGLGMLGGCLVACLSLVKRRFPCNRSASTLCQWQWFQSYFHGCQFHSAASISFRQICWRTPGSSSQTFHLPQTNTQVQSQSSNMQLARCSCSSLRSLARPVLQPVSSSSGTRGVHRQQHSSRLGWQQGWQLSQSTLARQHFLCRAISSDPEANQEFSLEMSPAGDCELQRDRQCKCNSGGVHTERFICC